MNTSKRNSGMIFLGLFFIAAFTAELLFLPHIGGIKYFLGLPVLAGSALFLFEEEDPVQAGKFIFMLALTLVPCAIMLLLYAHAKDMQL